MLLEIEPSLKEDIKSGLLCIWGKLETCLNKKCHEICWCY